MRYAWPALAVLLLATTHAFAQDVPAGASRQGVDGFGDANGNSAMLSSRVTGMDRMFQMRGEEILRERNQQAEDDGCRKNGCVVIVNGDKRAVMVGAYIDSDSATTDTPKAFHAMRIEPGQHVTFQKTGDERLCSIPVRPVFKDPKTGKLVPPITGYLPFCREPGSISIERAQLFEVADDQVAPAAGAASSPPQSSASAGATPKPAGTP